MARCTAKNATGNQCRKDAINGATVCRNHGGSAPQVKAKAAERVATEKAVGLLSKLGQAEPVTDPLGALLEIAGRSRRLLAMLETQVDELASIRYENTAGGEQLRGEIGAYMTMLDRCRAVLVDILRLDIDERMARVEERQVEVVLKALEAGLLEAGLEDHTREVIGNVGRHLHAVTG